MTCYTGWGGPEQNQNTLDKRKNFRNHRDNSTKHKMISAEELLKPISDENPCGEDLYYDPSFQELESLMKGKAEMGVRGSICSRVFIVGVGTPGAVSGPWAKTTPAMAAAGRRSRRCLNFIQWSWYPKF